MVNDFYSITNLKSFTSFFPDLDVLDILCIASEFF